MAEMLVAVFWVDYISLEGSYQCFRGMSYLHCHNLEDHSQDTYFSTE
jgi:hypothetical protein